MEISFETGKMAGIFNTEKELVRGYGSQLAGTIKRRMAVLSAARCLADVPVTPPFRRHELAQNRKGQFAVDLDHRLRLVFRPNHNPLPVKPDGGLDLSKITEITILEVKDYH